VLFRSLHRIFTPDDDRKACATGCRTAGIGCLDCKGVLLTHMLPPLETIRERRRPFAEKPREIVEILHEGSKRARKTAIETIAQVRAAVRLEP
jgi:tryptophanyl-tRNA synthetase